MVPLNVLRRNRGEVVMATSCSSVEAGVQVCEVTRRQREDTSAMVVTVHQSGKSYKESCEKYAKM